MADTSLAPWVQIGSTLVLGVLAIWKEAIVAKLSPLKVDAEIVHPAGNEEEGGRMYTYHLKVINKTPGRPVTNCRVQLIGISRRNEGSKTFDEAPFPVPWQFMWAPAEDTPKAITFSHWWSVDFGTLKGTGFFANLYPQGGSCQPELTIIGAVRWTVLISADNLAHPVEKTYEISWDGRAEIQDSQRREKILQIKDITASDHWDWRYF